MNQKYPVLPLRDVVVYPNVVVPLFVARTESIFALEEAMKAEMELILLPQKDPSEYDPDFDALHEIGTLSRIVQLTRLNDGTVKALVEGIERVKVTNIEVAEASEVSPHYLRIFNNELEANYLVGTCEAFQTSDPLSGNESFAFIDMALNYFSQYLKHSNREPQEIVDALRKFQDPVRVADTIAAHLDMELFSYQDRVALLSEPSIRGRLFKIFALFESERDKFHLEDEIKKMVREQIEKNQREYYLNEKIKVIQKELNEIEGNEDENTQLEKAIKEAKMSEEAEKKALGELAKLKQMSPMSSEATVIRNYLDWMTDFPWSKTKKVRYDLEKADNILNRDHFGLQDVKERILELLAVQKRNPKGKAPIICLVGPPGVGKTSLGKSIAEATGRDFVRIALGGVRDEAEIRGHRRTYIGSMPGKIVQKLCKLQSNNPVMLLDEIDKIGTDHRGDPADALLEVLDPAQNSTFSDHYLECDVDLSKVLFIATANTLNIPTPLLDRMEVIRIPGYTPSEKLQIAQRYILPRQLKEHALKTSEIKMSKNLLATIIDNYTREAGVRNLDREIGKLARKSVRKLLEKNAKSISISEKNLEDFLGTAKFRRNEDDLKPKIGTVTGLAWTSVGGELLQIETVAFSGKGKLNYTGQLGDVMKESVQAAMTVVRTHLDEHDPEFQIDKYDLHMHLPEGATPKDGPSAGIAMATVLLSALTKKAIRGDIAMTGEITIHGKVLAIGGLKEKLLAAQRGHIKTVFIPKDNMQDLRDVPDEVKKSLKIVAVSHISEVFKQAFEDKKIPLKVGIVARPSVQTSNLPC